jgi:uncharacterized membrane protein (UPF0127 family)
MPAVTLVNYRTQTIVANRVEVADTRRARRRGLLGRDRVEADAAMLLTPCRAVHTAFMGFPIDVVFIDRYGRTVQLVHGLQPWRMAVSLRAHAVIELAAGRLQSCGVEPGDRLFLAPEACA